MSQRVAHLGTSIVVFLLAALPEGTGLHLAESNGRRFLHNERAEKAKGKPCVGRFTPVPTLPPPGPPPLKPLKVLPKLSADMLPKLGPLPTPVPKPPLPTPAPARTIGRIEDPVV